MKVVLNTVSVTPHMVPFALALSSRLPAGDFVYIDRGSPDDPNRAVGVRETARGILHRWTGCCSDNQILREADVLIQNIRDFDLMDARARHGLVTVYQSERWFKPIKLPGFNVSIPGFFKMIAPFAIKRALRIIRLFRSSGFYYFPLGVHAARDMARLCGLMHGDLRCIFRAPKIDFERKAGGRVFALDGRGEKYCLDRMRMWGYWVAPSQCGAQNNELDVRRSLRILWVGRMLRLKRVDDIINAVLRVNECTAGKCLLTIVGDGPDKMRLVKCARGSTSIKFIGSVPLAQVRVLMRNHDVYVFSSNEHEGWGAVVNEAMEEGMRVIGTEEAGASITMLPKECLYHAGDIDRLSTIIVSDIPLGDIGSWSADYAAQSFLGEFIK